VLARPTAHELEAIAARFVILRDQRPLDLDLRAEIEEWTELDKRNKGALLSAEAAWAALDFIGDDAADPTPARKRWPAFLAGGAATGIAATLAFFFVPASSAPEQFSTMKGEMRRIPLTDMSSALVSSDSKVITRFTPEVRTVELVKGEAWFKVAKNRVRPFVVERGSFRVEAVGTAFSVTDEGESVQVLVTEGIVKVWNTQHPERIIRVAKGSGVRMDKNGRDTVIASSADDVDRKLSWRTGRLELAGEPLSYAIAEMNRHNRMTIHVGNARITDKKLYGAFRLDDPEGFARTAADVLDVRIRTQTDSIELY
jgi:transmembrane sensor